MEDKIDTMSGPSAVRIGKVDFSVRMAEGQADAAARQRRTEALVRWLLAQWRLEQGKRN